MKRCLYLITIVLFLTYACKNAPSSVPEKRIILGKEGRVKKEISKNTNDTICKPFSKEVVDLNEKATNLILDREEDSYNEALDLLGEAIAIDSGYYTAYLNKALVFTRLKRYEEAIKTYDYVATFVKQDYPEALSMIGMLYDRLGNDSLARKFYEKAIFCYSKRIKQKENVLDMVNHAHLIYILDKEKGLKEIDSLIIAYPKDIDIPVYKEYLFLQYDHKKYLDDL